MPPYLPSLTHKKAVAHPLLLFAVRGTDGNGEGSVPWSAIRVASGETLIVRVMRKQPPRPPYLTRLMQYSWLCYAVICESV